jgi:hypothetical protein
MRSAVGNGLCRFVIGISCRTMLGCGPQMCSDVADLIRRSSVVHSAARSCAKAADRYATRLRRCGHATGAATAAVCLRGRSSSATGGT